MSLFFNVAALIIVAILIGAVRLSANHNKKTEQPQPIKKEKSKPN